MNEILSSFIKIRIDNKILYIRKDAASELMNKGIANLEELIKNSTDKKIFQGRGETISLPIKEGGNGSRMVIRHYHHGGILRKLTGDIYPGINSRPFNELVVSELARRKGVNTPEVLAIIIKTYWGFFYRADIITKEVENSINAYDYFKSLNSANRGNTVSRIKIIKEMADAIKKMHDVGIYHRDLNFKNILIQQIEGRINIFILDLDRGYIKENLSDRKRKRNLLRLNRSVDKLGKDSPLVLKRDKLVFFEQYYRLGS